MLVFMLVESPFSDMPETRLVSARRYSAWFGLPELIRLSAASPAKIQRLSAGA
jgi:hypothetical protein